MSSRSRRNVLLEEIAFAATAMAQASDWRDGIDALLERLGRAARVSRVYLFEVGLSAAGKLTHTCRHDWAAPGLARLAGAARYTHEVIEDYDLTFDSWVERRRKGELIRGHTRDLTGPLRDDFDYQEIKSFISVPLHVEGKWWGHLGFDDCMQERDWVSDEVNLLQTTAALIAASASHEGAARKVREGAALRAAMLDVALDAIIMIDTAGIVLEFNAAAETIFGYRRGAVAGRPIADAIVPPRLRAAHEKGFRAATVNRHLARAGRRNEMVALRADGTEFPIELSLTQIEQGQQIVYAAFIRDLTQRYAAEERMRAVEHERANLARFFSPQLVDHLVAIETPLSTDHYQPASALFVDMIGFTGFCAENTPATVIATLRELLAQLCQQVFDHGGTIDKFLGDGLMAVFGSPRPGPSDATNAVRCSLDMLQAVDRWNLRCGRSGNAAIEVAVGIHTGNVILGDIGSERRLEFAVLGDTVNVASRVEGKCRSLDTAILVTSDVVDAVAREGGKAILQGFTALGAQTLRGRSASVELYGIPRNRSACQDPSV